MSQNIFEYLNIISSDTPRLISKADSDQEINVFLQSLIKLNAKSNVCVFIVGPFICFMELLSTSNDITFWIAGDDDNSPQIKDLSQDSNFKSPDWMKYYQFQKKVFEIPLSELYKIIQHLLRINRLKYFL